jgi:hypothetical protein
MNKEAKAARKFKSNMWNAYRESKAFIELVEYKKEQTRQLQNTEGQKRQLKKVYS